jgi:electron transfer flavoprotein alpha subunit
VSAVAGSGTVLVLVETDSSGATEVSREALTFVRRLVEPTGAEVHAVLVGPVPEDLTQTVLAQLGELGVAAVHHGRDERLERYAAAAWATALVDVVRDRSAAALVAAGSPRGNEILAHAATRLGVAMAANVVEVDGLDPLVVRRQVVGGSALEQMRLEDPVAVLSVAGHACDPAPAEQPTRPELAPYSPTLGPGDLRAQVARTEPAAGEDTSALTGARVVVGAGRGVGAADGFGDLLQLTELLGGALGVSRVVTSLGWRPHHEQVGQTGSRISPDLYLACGISGAIQHWAGCQSARTIIAINTDADAPMVTKADYAVIGDLHEIVPAVIEEIRSRLGTAVAS